MTDIDREIQHKRERTVGLARMPSALATILMDKFGL